MNRHGAARLLSALIGLGAVLLAAPAPPARHEGPLPHGGTWVADVPTNWNGTVLLFSHGFNAGPANPARNNTRQGRDWFLEHGYALLGSSYRSVGWSLEDAVPDQVATLAAFKTKVGTPKRTIAYGESMGGLVTLGLIERHPDLFDGAMPMCASVAGVIGMMNQALDATFTLHQLVDPALPLTIVRVGAPQTGPDGRPALQDDPANMRLLLDKAHATPAGQARLVLASVLAQIPEWGDPAQSPPAETDLDAIEQSFFKAFAMGAFFPRRDQEQRAGGNFSWNTGIDYRQQLARSGRRLLVEAFYRRAGVDLDKDLDALAKAPRISPDATAVSYMRRNYVPSGDLKKPVLSIHTVGDAMTMVNYEQAYEAMVTAAGKAGQLRLGFTKQAGHCTFNDAETVAAILTLESRIATGRWPTGSIVAPLNQAAAGAGLGAARFIDFTPAPFLRPCSAREAKCAGEP